MLLDHAELLLPCINQGIDGKRSRAHAATSLMASEGTRDEAAGRYGNIHGLRRRVCPLCYLLPVTPGLPAGAVAAAGADADVALPRAAAARRRHAHQVVRKVSKE